MPTPEKLRFRARDTALCPNHALEANGVKAFIGRKMKEDGPGRWGFAPTGEDEEVAYDSHYVKACAEGDLYAADEETAKACDAYARAHGLPTVKFDPSFGGSPKKGDKPADKSADSAAQKG